MMFALSADLRRYKSVRNSNIEVFRCLLMFLIVLYHYGNECVARGSTSFWSLIFTAFILWHVDGFVAISGWFGIKFSWLKFFRLWGLIVFYWFLGLVYRGFQTVWHLVPNDFYFTGGWFGGTYLALMLFSPILNAGLKSLVAESARKAWYCWGLFAAIIFLGWIPFHLFTCVEASGGGSHTFLTMMFVYVTARMCALTDMSKIRLKWIVLAWIGFFGGVFLTGLPKMYLVYRRTGMADWSRCNWLVGYDAPFVVLMAIATFLFFMCHAKLPQWICRCATFIGPSTFAIYLMHTGNWMTAFVSRPAIEALKERGVHPLFIAFAIAIIVYVACVLVDLVRRGGLQMIKVGARAVIAMCANDK